MAPPELGLWLTIGTVVLLATAAIFLPVRGGHGRHAHAGPGALTVAQLHVTTQPSDPDDDIIRPPEPAPEPVRGELAPVERDLHQLLHPTRTEPCTGRHRRNEPGETYSPSPGLRVELTEPIPA